MGIARSVVLAFVIDTTGSMVDDIEEAKRVTYNIIDSKKGTQDEPSEYILVPFNDPGECSKKNCSNGICLDLYNLHYGQSNLMLSEECSNTGAKSSTVFFTIVS